MNVEEVLYQIRMKRLLRDHELNNGKKRTKREEAVLRGKIAELDSLVSLIENLSNQETI